jgi:hypothetical protein
VFHPRFIRGQALIRCGRLPRWLSFVLNPWLIIASSGYDELEERAVRRGLNFVFRYRWREMATRIAASATLV